MLWKRGEIAPSGAISPLFHNILNTSISPSSGVKLHNDLQNVVVWFIFFLNSANLICRGMDISKYFKESLRDFESQLYLAILIRAETWENVSDTCAQRRRKSACALSYQTLRSPHEQYADWSASSLDVLFRRYVFWRRGSYISWLYINYSRTSMARTSLGPWKFVRDMGSSSHCGLIWRKVRKQMVIN